jgi:hypothetical protein
MEGGNETTDVGFVFIRSTSMYEVTYVERVRVIRIRVKVSIMVLNTPPVNSIMSPNLMNSFFVFPVLLS